MVLGQKSDTIKSLDVIKRYKNKCESLSMNYYCLLTHIF